MEETLGTENEDSVIQYSISNHCISNLYPLLLYCLCIEERSNTRVGKRVSSVIMVANIATYLVHTLTLSHRNSLGMRLPYARSHSQTMWEEENDLGMRLPMLGLIPRPCKRRKMTWVWGYPVLAWSHKNGHGFYLKTWQLFWEKCLVPSVYCLEALFQEGNVAQWSCFLSFLSWWLATV